jgi:hypothetical protein
MRAPEKNAGHLTHSGSEVTLAALSLFQPSPHIGSSPIPELSLSLSRARSSLTSIVLRPHGPLSSTTLAGPSPDARRWRLIGWTARTSTKAVETADTNDAVRRACGESR